MFEEYKKMLLNDIERNINEYNKEIDVNELNKKNKIDEIDKINEFKRTNLVKILGKMKQSMFKYNKNPFTLIYYKINIKKFELEYDKYNSEINDLEKEKEIIKTNASKNYEEIKDNISKYIRVKEAIVNNNDKIFINFLFEKYPQLRKNIEFMKEVIHIDSSYIKYDLTNDKNLYIYYIENNKEKILEEYTENSKDNIKFKIEKFIEEIKNPKDVEKNKYQIPMEYVFEALRNSSIDILPIIDNYNRCKNKIDLELGNLVEKKFRDGFHILLHSTTFHFDREEDKIQKIFQNGLTYGATTFHGLNLNSTTIEYKNFFDIFNNFTSIDYSRISTILLALPQSAYDENTDVPVWGSNQKQPQPMNTFILPEYILGEISNNQNSETIFTKNNIPLNERTKYKYHYKDNTVEPINDITENNSKMM